MGDSEVDNICVYLLSKTPTVVVFSSHMICRCKWWSWRMSQVSYKPSGETYLELVVAHFGFYQLACFVNSYQDLKYHKWLEWILDRYVDPLKF